MKRRPNSMRSLTMAAYRLTWLGLPTSSNIGFSAMAEKIRQIHPEFNRLNKRATVEAFIQVHPKREPGQPTKQRQIRVAHKRRTGFYWSAEWRELRYRILVQRGARCECCGASPRDGRSVHVDHIKPRSKYPALELDPSNLQVLCEDCNLGKRHLDETDWREKKAG